MLLWGLLLATEDRDDNSRTIFTCYYGVVAGNQRKIGMVIPEPSLPAVMGAVADNPRKIGNKRKWPNSAVLKNLLQIASVPSLPYCYGGCCS